MKIAEEIEEEGRIASIVLTPKKDNFALSIGEKTLGEVSLQIIETICLRYGRTLETAVANNTIVDSLQLNETTQLHIWLYRAKVDLEAKTYVLFARENKESLALLAKQFSNSICFLFQDNK